MDNAVFTNAAIRAEESERAAFIRRTYMHLGGAILAFAVLETMLQLSPLASVLTGLMVGRFSWFIVLAAFMGVSYLANNWARSDTSQQKQYLGLGLYVFAEAILFVPLLFIASRFAGDNVIPTALMLTGFLFLGLTAVVLLTRKDFSWLGSILAIGGFVALGFIVASMIFGFSLGLIFSAIMVVYAGGAILYETSNILHQYRTDQHVAASLGLFASVALLFWYVLRIVMGSRD